jgi:hypothetical protein
MPPDLSEEHRKKLDSIVQQMVAAKEPDANVQFVVDDFKKKYAGQGKQPGFMQKALGFGANALASMTNTTPIKGVLKGAAYTAMSAGDIAAGDFRDKIPGREQLDKTFTPTKAEKPWYMGEQFAEFFIPTGTGEIKAAANAPRWIKALVGAGREALDIGMKTFAQTKDPMAALKAAVIGGAVGAISGGLAGKDLTVKSRLSPKSEAAQAEVRAQGIPSSVGDRTGNPNWRMREQRTALKHGAVGKMEDFAERKSTESMRAIKEIPARVGGKSGTEVEAGADIERGVKGRYSEQKQVADKEYTTVREETAKARRIVQTGTKKSSVLDARGNPVETPIMSTVEAPVPMAPIRSKLTPYFDELTGTLPQAVKDNSPGYAALRDIVQGKEESIDALKLDKGLSALKGFMRKYGGGPVDKSGRYAMATIEELEGGMAAALKKEAPGAYEALLRGRAAVKKYAYANELLSRLLPDNASTSVIFDKLTTASGRMLPDLKVLKGIAPEEVKTVGRAYLQGLVDHMTEGGKTERVKSALNKFRNLQPEVREILFGKAQSEKIDNLLQGIRDNGIDTNPSGSGKWGALEKVLGGAAGAATTGFTASGHLEMAAASAGLGLATAGAKALFNNRLAWLMTSERGIRMLTNTLKLPESSKGFSRALEALGALASEPEAQQPPQ